jgi:hypothetical protein
VQANTSTAREPQSAVADMPCNPSAAGSR